MGQAPEAIERLPDGEIERLARKHFDLMRTAEHQGLREAKLAGDYLRERKRRLAHGAWLLWLREWYPKSEDLAEEAMSISEHWATIEPWLNEDPELSKRRAFKRLREALRPKPSLRLRPTPVHPPPRRVGENNRVVFGRTWQLDADESVDAAGERLRADLGREVVRCIKGWHPDIALLVGSHEGAQEAVLSRLEHFKNEIEPLARFLGALRRRMYRQARNEREFGLGLEVSLGGERRVSEDSFNDDLVWAAGRILTPLSPLQREVIKEFLRCPAADTLRPVERELLDGLLAGT